MSVPPLDRRLLFVLQRASRAAVGHANARLLGALDVSVAQLATLSYVAANPGCALTDLADVLDLNKSAVTTMVGRLERAGLVTRHPNPRDGRSTLLRPTAKGDDVRQRSKPHFRKVIASMTAGFEEREVEVVLRFMNALVQRFGSETQT